MRLKNFVDYTHNENDPQSRCPYTTNEDIKNGLKILNEKSVKVDIYRV